MRLKILAAVLFVAFAGVPTSLLPAGLTQVGPWYQAEAQIDFGGQISEIIIQGNQRFSDEVVLQESGLRLGDDFDPATLNAALKALVSKGIAHDLAFERNGDTLIIRVMEPRFVNRIFFEGNEALRDDRLIQLIDIAPADPYSEPDVQRAVTTLLAAYAAQGRFHAEVRPYISDRGEGRLDLIFEIAEGEVSRVDSVNFVGNASFSDTTLRGVVSTKQYNAIRSLTNADRFTQLAIQRDEQALVNFYQQRGYVDVRVSAAQGALAPDQSGFVVTFALQEGQRYRVGDIGVTSDIAELEVERLRGAVRIRQNAFFNAEQTNMAQERLRSRAEALGFGAAEVQMQLTRRAEEGPIDVQFRIINGPNVRVERIEIEGNLRTRDYVIRREMRLAEGDQFSRNRLQRSIQRIRGLGYFSDAAISTRPGSSPDQAIVTVTVQETSTGKLNFAGGASTTGTGGGSFSLSYNENNFLGRGQKISAAANFGSGTRNYNLSIQEPWILGREISGGGNIFSSRTNANASAAYQLDETGFSLNSGYKLSEKWTQNWTYTRKTSDVSNATSTSPIILDQLGRTSRSVIGTRLGYNDLDSFFTPSSGLVFNGSLELAGGAFGGDVDWQLAKVDASYFFPVSETLVLKLKGSAGYMGASNGQPVPLVDRFVQGKNLVRGFAAAGIGPRTSTTGDSVGATQFYGSSAELRLPFPGLKDSGVYGRVFVDVGTAFDHGSGYDLDFGGGVTPIQDSSSFRAAYGLGLTWLSPIGPIRLDWATPTSKQTFDRTQEFSFNFGLGL